MQLQDPDIDQNDTSNNCRNMGAIWKQWTTVKFNLKLYINSSLVKRGSGVVHEWKNFTEKESEGRLQSSKRGWGGWQSEMFLPAELGSVSSLCAEHELLSRCWQRHAHRLDGAGTERGEASDATCWVGPSAFWLRTSTTEPPHPHSPEPDPPFSSIDF